MYSTTCDYGHVTSFTYIEIVINKILQPCSTQNNRYVHTLLLGSRLDYYINSRLILLGNYINIGSCASSRSLTIHSEIICSCRHLMKTGNLLEKTFLNRIHILLMPPVPYNICSRCPQPEALQGLPPCCRFFLPAHQLSL